MPTFDVANPDLAKAIGASLLIGIGGGVLLALLAPAIFGFYIFDILVFVGLGYVIGEGVSRSVNRKRGRALQYVAGSGVVVALLTVLLVGGLWTITTILGALAGVYMATAPFRS